MESALLKLPATLSKEPNGRQAHLFLALVPGTGALVEGPRSWGTSRRIPEPLCTLSGDPCPSPTPRRRWSPRAPAPSSPFPKPPRGPYLWRRAAGQPRVSQLPCLLQESCKSSGKERDTDDRCLRFRKGKLPLGAQKGSQARRAGAGQAGLHYPHRTSPASASEHARNCGACVELERLRSRAFKFCALPAAFGSVGT